MADATHDVCRVSLRCWLLVRYTALAASNSGAMPRPNLPCFWRTIAVMPSTAGACHTGNTTEFLPPLGCLMSGFQQLTPRCLSRVFFVSLFFFRLISLFSLITTIDVSRAPSLSSSRLVVNSPDAAPVISAPVRWLPLTLCPPVPSQPAR